MTENGLTTTLLLLLITGPVYRLVICDRKSYGFKMAQNFPHEVLV